MSTLSTSKWTTVENLKILVKNAVSTSLAQNVVQIMFSIQIYVQNLANKSIVRLFLEHFFKSIEMNDNSINNQLILRSHERTLPGRKQSSNF